MKDDTPSNGTDETAKKPHRSKTVWLNLVAMVAAFVPALHEWLTANPVEFVSALAALNILVRFVTSGKISLFGGKAAGLAIGFGAGLAALSLPSCTGYNWQGEVRYRHEETGAKGGLRFEPGAPPLPFFRVPIETASGSGFVDLTSGK